jgi:hypothetical protein
MCNRKGRPYQPSNFHILFGLNFKKSCLQVTGYAVHIAYFVGKKG